MMTPREAATPVRRYSRWRLYPAHLVAGGLHGLDDVLITGAAAKVGREHVEQFLVADVRPLLQRVGGEHQEARRTIAALQPVMRDERLLQRMQLITFGQTLY